MARTLTKTAHAPAQFSQASIALYDQAQPGMLATTTTGRMGIITEKFVSLGGMPHVWLQEPGAALTSQPIDLIAKVENKPYAVILFAGGGGVECGMVAAGIEPILSVEYDPDKPDVSGAITDCHKKNFPRCKVIRRTVQECAAENFAFFPQEPDILWASPVCSNFSAAKNGEEQIEDVLAAKAVVQAIAAMSPKHFLLENVTGYASSVSWGGLKESIPQVEINQLNPNLFLSLISRPVVIKAYAIFALGFWVFRAVQEPDHKPWRGIEAHIKQLGYQVDSSAVNMSDYGVPQARVRFIVRACREGNPLPLPEKQPKISWYDAIADLIPALPDSKLLDGQQKSVDKFLKANAPVPLLVNRGIGRTCYKVVPSHDPAKTVMRSHFTDHRGNSRSKFADIWLPDGTVKSVSIECMARLQSFPDWYQLPNRVAIAGSIIGYSVPPRFVEQLVKPLTDVVASDESGLVISFGRTLEQLLNGKTVTRRLWKDTHAQKFINAYERGARVQALDKDQRYGGKQIGWLTLKEKPYQERLADMPSSDLAAEGFPDLSRDEFIDQFFECDANALVWVIRFDFESLDREEYVTGVIASEDNGDNSIVSTNQVSDYSALSIAEICRDGGTQPREKLDLAHVAVLKEAIEEGADLEPVTVFYDGSNYWLADGFHRCKATEEGGFEDIQCIIYQGTRRDAILYSVGANAEHKAAKPRSRADKRRAVTMLLNDQEWSKWSNCEVARRCKVSESFVRSLRLNEVRPGEGTTRTYTTKHGTTATMQVGNIGNANKGEESEASASDGNGNGINRPANRWYGGKWRIGKWIASHFPEHKIYVEPFGGMWSVGLQKPQSEVEVYNDIHPGATNFWLQLRDTREQLISLLDVIDFNEKTVQEAQQPSTDPVECAVKFYIQCRISYAGGGTGWASGYSPKSFDKKENSDHSHLVAIAKRIKNLQIHAQDALDIIREFDSPDTLFYCDPPYLESTRNSHVSYEYEFDRHEELIALLSSIQGKVIISGYPSFKYASLLSSWSRKDTQGMTTSRKDATECIWIKPDLPAISPDDYALAFLSNLDSIKTDLLREARSRIDTKLNREVDLNETVKAVVENADRFSADEVRLMIEVLLAPPS